MHYLRQLQQNTVLLSMRISFLILLLLLVYSSPAFAQTVTSITYSNDPTTSHVGTYGANPVITYTGVVGDVFTLNGQNCTTMVSPVQQCGGWEPQFAGGGNGQVFTVTPGGASCTLVIAGGYRYCGVGIPDSDGDGIDNAGDNCPADFNSGQENNDSALGDTQGDACDPDDDNDGVPDAAPDNCQFVANPGQADNDRDGTGDDCDNDDDNDGISDGGDNCRYVGNPDQADLDGDAIGDPCDPDEDGDGFPDGADNCERRYQFGQSDYDGDGIGDDCDDDLDGDGRITTQDNCPTTPNADQVDINGNGVGDACENLPTPTPQPNLPSRICPRYEGVNIRQEPSLESDIVGAFTEESPPTAAEIREEILWYRVGIGWVSSSVILIDGACDQLPLPSNYSPEIDFGESFDSSEMLASCPPDISSQANRIPRAFLYAYRNDDCASFTSVWRTMTTHNGRLLPLSGDAIYRNCQESGKSALVPPFINIMFILSPSIREILDAYLAQLENPCDFISSLITDHRLSDLPPNFDLSDTMELITVSCNRNITRQRLNTTVEQLVNLNRGDIENIFADDINVCSVIQIFVQLGDLTDAQSQLFTWFHETCGLPIDESLGWLVYAVGIGINASALASQGSANDCTDIENAFTRYPITIGILTEQDVQTINTIAGGLRECAIDDTDLFILTMLFWNQWQSLGQEGQNAILNAPNPCEALVHYLNTGQLPSRPSPIIRNPTIPDPTPPTPTASPESGFVERFIPQTPEANVDSTSGDNTREEFINTARRYGFPSDPAITNASGVLLASETNGEATYIRRLNSGQIQAIEALIDPNVNYPVMSSNGLHVAYIADGELRKFDTYDVNFVPLLTSTRLAELGLTIENSPLAWSPDDAVILVTLRNTQNVLGIYAVNAYEIDTEPQLLIENASHPSFSLDGYMIAFVHWNPQNQRSIAIWYASEMRSIVIPNPAETIECFAPAFGFNTLALMYSCTQAGVTEFYYYARCTSDICQPDGESVIVDLGFANIAGINRDSVGNVTAGPAPNYFAFDDGRTIYFGSFAPDNTWTTAGALNETGYNLFALRWALRVVSIIDDQRE